MESLLLKARKGFFIILILSLTSCFKKNNDSTEKVVLKVNQTFLDAKSFASLLSREIKHLTAISLKDKVLINQYKQKVIDDFTLQVVFRDWAKQNNIKVRKDGADGWQHEVSRVRSAYPDDISFRTALAKEAISFKQWQAYIRFIKLQKLVIKEIHKQIKQPTKKNFYHIIKLIKMSFIEIK